MNRTVVITGASDGIGREAARRLAAAGDRVVVVGRDPERTAEVAAEIGAPHHVADFADLSQVHRLADELLDAYPRIDVLANNAGGLMPPARIETIDGHELTFQVNHLAPFLLTSLLRERLRDSRASVIQTSSVAARRFARFDIDDLEGERRWDASIAYGNAKLANVLFTKELHRRYHAAPDGRGLSAVAFHPGVVATSFAGGSGGPFAWIYANPISRRLMSTPEKGGGRLAWLAEGTPDRTWLSGGFYARDRPARTNPLADDPELARRLWEYSADAVGVAQ